MFILELIWRCLLNCGVQEELHRPGLITINGKARPSLLEVCRESNI